MRTFGTIKNEKMQPSSLIANICLSATALIFLLMVTELHLKPAPRGGDYTVGHAWAVMILIFAFFISVALATAAIGARGGFQWVASSGTARFALVALGLLAIALAVGMGSAGPGEGPRVLRPVAFLLAVVVPLALIPAGFLLANDPLPGGVPSLLARRLTLLAFWPSAAFASVFVGLMMFRNLQQTFAAWTRDPNQLDTFEQGILTNIDNCDIQKDLVFMLVHTDANRKPIIRERALTKIKTRPDWQEELVRRLDSGWADEVFTFLASNEVDNKALFPEAIRTGVLRQASTFGANLRQSRDFYADHYIWEVGRILRTVERFEGMGVDYLPAVRELRAAFARASDRGKPPYKSVAVIDKWMRKRQ